MKSVISGRFDPRLGSYGADVLIKAPEPTKGLSTVALSFLTPAVLAGAFAAAIAFAPAAGAEDGDGDDLSTTNRGPRGTTSQQQDRASQAPKGWSNEALWSQPGTGSSNIFGTLPKPPIYALD